MKSDRYKKRYFWFLSIVCILGIAYLTWDYRGPFEIPLGPDIAFGVPSFRAKDLLIQGFDPEGHVWATRGMIAYRLQKGDTKFIRQAHIPTGISIYWLRNFSIVRRLTLRPECVEMIPMANGEILALSAGHIWHRPSHGDRFMTTMTLPHYGISLKGNWQGIHHGGITRLEDGTILIGEYFEGSNKNVRIYSSKDNGRTWQVFHEFQPGQIRHVHSVQKDPYSDKVWICTGDKNHESMIAWTKDGGKNLVAIGKGSQVWRVTQLVFTKDAVFWGTDTGDDEVSGIYRWDRKTHDLKKLISVDGTVFYGTRLAMGTIVFSTVREGARNEKDDKTRLWVLTEGETVVPIEAGTWNRRLIFFKFAKLRFQREEGGSSLFITWLNQKEFNDGDLTITSEEILKEIAKRMGLQASLHQRIFEEARDSLLAA